MENPQKNYTSAVKFQKVITLFLIIPPSFSSVSVQRSFKQGACI